MSLTWAETARFVRTRAGDRCEYCFMHQSLQGGTFHVDHILPKCQGGSDSPDNLALSCPSCNLGKSSRTTAPDPETGGELPLFNPRTDAWADHLGWEGHQIVGHSPRGLALIAALNLNHPRRLRIREAEEWFGLFPP